MFAYFYLFSWKFGQHFTKLHMIIYVQQELVHLKIYIHSCLLLFFLMQLQPQPQPQSHSNIYSHSQRNSHRHSHSLIVVVRPSIISPAADWQTRAGDCCSSRICNALKLVAFPASIWHTYTVFGLHSDKVAIYAQDTCILLGILTNFYGFRDTFILLGILGYLYTFRDAFILLGIQGYLYSFKELVILAYFRGFNNI